MKTEIRVIVKEPGQAPEFRTIPNTLEALQKLVGGYIECVSVFRGRLLCIVNEEGRLLGLPRNCEVDGFDLCGTVVLVTADDEGEFDDVPRTLTESELPFLFKN